MAKHGRGRRKRSFNLRKVRVSTASAVGALASLDVVSLPMTNTPSNSMRIISIDGTWGLADLGATSDDGQEFGVSHSDYTDTEVEACLEAAGSIDVGDKVSQEVANRLVRTIGQFTGAPGTGAGLSFNDGRPMKTRLNWQMAIGDFLRVWIRNGSGTVYTTGATVLFNGHIWVKDGF